MRRLTLKQARFVEVYAGNGVEAARLAGYKGGEATLAQQAYRMLRIAEIAEAIEARTKKTTLGLIADRVERQAYWTAVMRGQVDLDPQVLAQRLKAAELLGKSQADFIEKVEVSPSDSLLALLTAARKRDASESE